MQPALSITRLSLSEFRNYRQLHLEASAAPVVLTGANGAGKTNILEAISLFTPGRGMRSSPYNEILRETAKVPQWAVAISLDGAEGRQSLGTSWESDAPGSRKSMTDGQVAKGSGVFSSAIRVIWLTPAMDRLFAGPAGDRRRFLDRMVTTMDSTHPSRISAFEKLMRERNKLLSEHEFDASWVNVLEIQMAATGVAIAAARLEALDNLQGHINGSFGENHCSLFPSSRLVLEGIIEGLLRENPAVHCEDEYRKMLYDSRNSDQAAGRTLIGPHRSDMIVYHLEKDIQARRCSTGEQKALLTGLILAHAKTVKSGFNGYMPILLLDEIAAHLDEQRRGELFDEICRLRSQCWMTGTDRTQFAALEDRAQFFQVSDGCVN